MWNIIINRPDMFITAIMTFVIVLFLRQAFLKRKILAIGFHTIIFTGLLVLGVGGGGVQNDGYKALKSFQDLEESGRVQELRNNPGKIDYPLSFYFYDFESSKDFEAYLKTHDKGVDCIESAFIGWLLALIAEFCLLLVSGMRSLRHKKSG